jgi:hypothetical protein
MQVHCEYPEMSDDMKLCLVELVGGLVS